VIAINSISLRPARRGRPELDVRGPRNCDTYIIYTGNKRVEEPKIEAERAKEREREREREREIERNREIERVIETGEYKSFIFIGNGGTGRELSSNVSWFFHNRT